VIDAARDAQNEPVGAETRLTRIIEAASIKSLVLALFLMLVACDRAATTNMPADAPPGARPDIIATNAFYYYADIDGAWAFYRDTLGFETVADYGFAKILRLAETSYLTLVRADAGMHSADEPKTVTLTLLTDTLEPWYEHLTANNVDMRTAFPSGDGGNANSFVAVDTEGYVLKFLRFNPHPNHDEYIAAFSGAQPLNSLGAPDLSIRATAFSAYFDDVDAVSEFYEGLFATDSAGELQGHDLYQLSSSGFLVLVDGGDELHRPTVQNGVTLSFLTSDVDAWFARATAWPGFELRTPEILNESGLVRVFVGYDPTGIFLEWDTFLDLEDNARLLRHLAE
jgi:predicted enzyme related to lactoylglutathione lyase